MIHPNEFADWKPSSDLRDKPFDLILRHVRVARQYPQIIPRRAGNDSELVISLWSSNTWYAPANGQKKVTERLATSL